MESQVEARIRHFLSMRTKSARANREVSITFNAREVCGLIDMDSPQRFTLFCSILDSEPFLRQEGLEYHHRTGVWGTGDTTYTFDLVSHRAAGVGSDRSERREPALSQRSNKVILLFVVVVSLIVYILIRL